MAEVTTERKTPHELVKEEYVAAALQADQGKGAKLKTWSVKDFTKKGDNYMCVVSSVLITYLLDGYERETSYVVKLNPCRQTGTLNDIAVGVFEKEIRFYNQVVPLLNGELQNVGLEDIRFAKCYATCDEVGSEIIFLSDLRRENFRMFDRKKGMDKAHTTLVLKELARLHAASYLLMQKQTQSIVERFPFIKKDFTTFTESSQDDCGKFFQGHLNIAADIAEAVGGYDCVVKYLRDMIPQSVDIFEKQVEGRPPFILICHGDCWNNNVLFRYDDEGKPVDVRLVDLQICRFSSPATDLNYLLYTSLNGAERKENLQSFLETYHSSFSAVLREAKTDMPFTIDELMKEYRSKHIFGLMLSMMIVPLVVSEGSDVMDLDNVTDNNTDKLLAEHRERTLKQLQNNPLLRPRLLSIFDDMIEQDVIPRL